MVEPFSRFDTNSILGRVREDAYTLFMAVPTIYVKLIQAIEAASDADRTVILAGFRKLRLMVSGSAALPASVHERWAELTGQELLERYGMTETLMNISNPYAGERRPGSVGQPLPGVSVRLSDSGEVLLKGPNVFAGYWRRDDATEAAFDNGWFKSGNDGWPPHPAYAPIFLGFHIRLFQSPALLSPQSLAYYRSHSPIGCRDDYTADLLAKQGIDSFVSHCLSLSLPRRIAREGRHRIFVVSRDERLAEAMPPSLGDFTSLLHYSGDHDFWRNMDRAVALLDRYRDEAGLIVTSLLHCALPAIAMGIPVIMFYPPDSPAGRQSDMERFSSLSRLIPIHDVTVMDAMTLADWSPAPVEVGAIKLALIDRLSAALAAMGLAQARTVGPIAPSSILPPGARSCHSSARIPRKYRP